MAERIKARAYWFEGTPECCRKCESVGVAITLELPGTKRRPYKPHPECDCLVSLIRAEVEIELRQWSSTPVTLVQENTLPIDNCREGPPFNLGPDGTVLPEQMTVHMGQFGSDETNVPPVVLDQIMAAWQPQRGEPQSEVILIEQGIKLETVWELTRVMTIFTCELTYRFFWAGTDELLGEIPRNETFHYTALHSLKYLADRTLEVPCEVQLQWA